MDRLSKKIAAEEQKRNTLKARLNSTKPLDELRKGEVELKRENEQDQAVIDNQDASPSDREAAQARVAECNEEVERLAPQVAERE